MVILKEYNPYLYNLPSPVSEHSQECEAEISLIADMEITYESQYIK